jgi:hypothetical protein
LFHLCSLSLISVYWAETENVKAEKEKFEKEERQEAELGAGQSIKETSRYKPRIWRWRIMSSVHATSVRLLTMAIPILNVVLLEIAANAFVDKTHAKTWAMGVAVSFTAVLSLGATFLILRQNDSPPRPFLWAAVPFLGSALGTGLISGVASLYLHYFQLGISFPESLLVLNWLLTAGLMLGLVAKKFDELRPGAFVLSVVIYGLDALLFLLYLLPRAARLHVAAENQLATASLWAVQWIFGELVLAWLLCLVCAFLGWWPLSWLCKRGIENDNSRLARAIAAFRTGRFAFAVPATLFVIVTSVLWSGVLVYGSNKLRAFEGVPQEVENWEDSSPAIRELLIPKG